MRWYLARHAETDWVREERYQGHVDNPLSSFGVQQAERLRDRLASMPLTAVYASDLARSRQTAELVASAHGLEVQIHPGLREMCYGVFEGLGYEEARLRFPHEWEHWYGNRVHAAPPGGETYAEVFDRVAGFQTTVSGGDEDGILVVGHGGSLRCLVYQLLDMELEYWWRVQFDPASLSIIEDHDRGRMLTLLNDTCHLDGLVIP